MTDACSQSPSGSDVHVNEIISIYSDPYDHALHWIGGRSTSSPYIAPWIIRPPTHGSVHVAVDQFEETIKLAYAVPPEKF